jgi:hypothetical protein
LPDPAIKSLSQAPYLASFVDAQRELGFLKADLDIRKYADLSVVEEAAARLK